MSTFNIESRIPARLTGAETGSLKELLSTPSEFVITTHQNPDGDAMGSSLGFYNYLKKKGHKVSVIVPNKFPEFLNWLPGCDQLLNYENESSICDARIRDASVIFCLDFNQLNRVDKMEKSLRSSTAKKVLIDHHLNPETVFTLQVSYPDASSTSELIVDSILAMGDAVLIDKDIARCLYCGIMTDTNSFRYSSMKSRTHRIIASLMEAGAENYLIHESVYDNANESRLRLMGHILTEKLIVLPDFHTAYITLSEQELKKYNYQTGDTEGFVNLALGIKGIRLAVFFSEREGLIKISFRSKGNFSVQELSSKYFNGGGHLNASGGISKESMEKTVNRFLEVLPLYEDKLKNN